MEAQGHGVDSEHGWIQTVYPAWGNYKEENTNMYTKLVGGGMMGPARQDSSLVSSFLSSSPPSAAEASGSHTRIFQDPQALLALPVGPIPLKRHPQQVLCVPSPAWLGSHDFQGSFLTGSFPWGLWGRAVVGYGPPRKQGI